MYEEQFDEFGDHINRNILGKYDEEIDGAKSSAFSIGENIAEIRDQKRRLLEVILSVYCYYLLCDLTFFQIKTKLAGKRLESLNEPILKLASDVYTDDEIAK